ncbi:30S ribosomal protein S16 [PVC group bacterium (ex Bugula neritina AB1)]|nr:30S ribosomal protein S16 [PVC group bacterium (ex Bugula neritina AB1)]
MRLKRFGRKGCAYYRLVVTDRRRRRDGGVIEELGAYDPHCTDVHQKLKVDKERVSYWIGQGAQPTSSVGSLLKRQGFVENLR